MSRFIVIATVVEFISISVGTKLCNVYVWALRGPSLALGSTLFLSEQLRTLA